MGTNYYLHERDACHACGREYERLHIGKSSAGWCFSLHVIPGEGIRDLADWVERWSRPGARIVDEYGREVAQAPMLSIITERSWTGNSQRDEKWYSDNHASPGPNGLARHRYRATPGAGTWDLIEGEFS